MKLKSSIDNSVSVFTMQDGDVAVITKWTSNRYIGTVVQRVGNLLVTLGKGKDEMWPDFLEDSDGARAYPNCQVMVLTPGTELIV